MDEIAEQLASRLAYRFVRLDLLRDALTHTSVAGSGSGAQMERLEFLGDAVLGLAIADLLVQRHAGASEGDLTMARARLVNTTALAARAREIGLSEAVILGKGEEKTGGRDKASILAGVFEAVLGAVFLDGGFDSARRVVEHLFGEAAAQISPGEEDAKTLLQEMTQRMFKLLPVYETLRVEGPDHARDFVVEVSVGGEILGRGAGRSKRMAAQEAARKAVESLRARTVGNRA